MEAQFKAKTKEGQKLLHVGRYIEAEAIFRQLVQLQTRALGPIHPDTMSSMQDHGTCLSKIGKHAQAEAIFAEVLQLRQTTLGHDHHDTLESVFSYGLCLKVQNRPEQAEPMLRRIYALKLAKKGAMDPETISSTIPLAQTLHGIPGKVEEAETLLRDVYDMIMIGTDLTGVESAMHALIMIELGRTIRKLGKHIEAEALHKDAVRISRKCSGEQHPTTIINMEAYAICLTEMEKHAQAEVMYRIAWTLRQTVNGPHDRLTIHATNCLAACMSKQGKWPQAEALMRDLLTHLQGSLGEEDPVTLNWMLEVANCLQAQGLEHRRKYKEGMAMKKKAQDIMRKQAQAAGR